MGPLALVPFATLCETDYSASWNYVLGWEDLIWSECDGTLAIGLLGAGVQTYPNSIPQCYDV